MSVALDIAGLVLPEALEEQKRSEDERRASFLLQPLERGFGHTIGNSIRRILLSSLPGAAVWAFRADGVQHEHQTIPGVAEDVHQVIQNLKRLVLLLDAGVDETKLELSVYKAGTVTAEHITANSAVKIMNPEQELFTLQEDQPEARPLTVEFRVNRGRGFVMADQHPLPDDAPVGLIRIDSTYNPVVRANFAVHETRVGQRTDFDRLEIDVHTNGALDPAEAIAHAAQIARVHLGYLAEPGEVPSASQNGASAPVAGEAGDDGEGGSEFEATLSRKLKEFEQISSRSKNILEKADLITLGDVVVKTRDEMLNLEAFGEKSLEEVAEVLAINNLRFGMVVERDANGTLREVEADEE